MEEAVARVEQLRQEYEAKLDTYAAFARSLKELLHHLCNSRSIEAQTIDARAKTPASLVAKLTRYPNYTHLEEVKDLCGSRVILYYRSDLSLVRELFSDEFEVLDEEVHGAQVVDAFGYQSLHLIVQLKKPRKNLVEWAPYGDLYAEVQVRTVLAHAWAAISHNLDYKSSSQLPESSRRKLFRVAALLETGDDLFGEFREEVERLRQSYKSEATSNDRWQKLELNLDSLIASWSRLPVAKIKNAANRAGLRRSEKPDGPNDAEARRREIGDLVVIANSAGYRTIGDLARDIDRLLNADSLKQIAQETGVGFKPENIVANVLSILILLNNPQLIDVPGKELIFPRAVNDAIQSVAKSKSH